MKADLADQLRRLGLGKGPTAIRPAEGRRSAQRVESLIPGEILHAEGRACFVAEHHCPLDQEHGTRPLGALLELSPQVPAVMAGEPSLAKLSFREMLFLDTETTGLSRGTGTLAFLVGIGFFEGHQFSVRQYFLRDPEDEPAMLADLADQLSHRPGVVTFNGRGFDLPLLDGRFLLNRMRSPFLASPHLDLLQPARRLWRTVLDSCRLVALEEQIMGVQRDQADVPSGLIPLIYQDYLRTGNGIEMPRIFYHNRMDVLSLVGLMTHLGRVFQDPSAELRDGAEWFSLARWYEVLELRGRAEAAYRCAIQSDLAQDRLEAALRQLGRLLKRAGRRDDAAEVWQHLAAVEMDDVWGHVELAKYHEWHTGELEQAADWTRRALSLTGRWSRGMQQLTRPGLEHRLARLERKLA
jgi:uncharacterized protein YprB with RNaseH-like and TPR domain